MVTEMVGVEVTVGVCVIVGVELGVAVLLEDGLGEGVFEEIISGVSVWVRMGTPDGSGWTVP